MLNTTVTKDVSHPVKPIIAAQNEHIAANIVASDALGLLHQDIKPNHLHFIYAIFDLLRTLSTVGSLRPTETQTSFAPHLMMPVLFKSSVSVPIILGKHFAVLIALLFSLRWPSAPIGKALQTFCTR